MGMGKTIQTVTLLVAAKERRAARRARPAPSLAGVPQVPWPVGALGAEMVCF